MTIFQAKYDELVEQTKVITEQAYKSKMLFERAEE